MTSLNKDKALKKIFYREELFNSQDSSNPWAISDGWKGTQPASSARTSCNGN